MSGTEGVYGHGTTLEVATQADDSVYTPIAEITNLNPPAATVDSIEYTSHDSVDDNGQPVKEFGPGSIDAGQITFDYNLIPGNSSQNDGADGLYGIFLSRDKRKWRVTFPTTPAVKMNATGFITAITPAAPQDNKLSGNATIKLTGGIAFA